MRDLTGDALERRIAGSLAPAMNAGADVAVAHDGDDHTAAKRAWPTESSSIFVMICRRREEAVIACAKRFVPR